MVVVVISIMTGWKSAPGANVMNYGADGNDYFRFVTPSMAFDKASGFTTLIAFAMHVDADGTLELGGGPVCSNGVYIGPSDWNSLIAMLKTPPTTVTRYEVCIGGWQDASFDNVKSLIAAQGNGSGSMLYKNFQALKNAVPGIDAINDDDEKTYDQGSSTRFANMLGGLGFKFTMVPYTAQSFWVNLNNAVTNCDFIYLQCYEGGAGNDPGQWNTAFGHGVKVIPGQESNGANPATWSNWYQETGTQGGFYYPDVVFNNTYWSALIYQANGGVTAAPAGFAAVAGGQQVCLFWNTVPGAISYNIKRSTLSGGETNVASISAKNTWPNSNQYIDVGLAANLAYYYEISGVNTNGEGAVSVELIAIPQPASVLNFETPNIGSGNYKYYASGGTWTFSGASPNGSGLAANGSAFGNPNAPGTNQQAGFVQEYGVCSQTIAGFVPGTDYTITFSAAERSGNSQTWNLKIDGWVIGSYSPGSSATGFTDYSASFTATASTHNLQFVGTDLTGGDNTVFLADVRISPPLLPVSNVTLLATDASGTSSFTGSTNWSNGQAPSATSYYFTRANCIRTTNFTGNGSTFPFAGVSLSIDSGGRLLGKIGNSQNMAASGTISGNFILNGGYMDQAGGNAGSGDSTYMAVAGTVAVNASSGIGAAGASGGYYETLEFLAPISGYGALQQGGTNNSTWAAGLAKETGLVKLSAANPYSGTYTIPNSGSGANPPSAINRMLQLNNLNALSNATLNLVTTTTTNPVSFAHGVNTAPFNVGALSGSTSEVLSDTVGSAVVLSVGGNNASTTYSGNLTGNGSLIKVGTGTLTLAGTNTYTGNTTVNGGTLELEFPALATNSTVTVASGAVLQLDFAVTNVVSGLVLNGLIQPAGIYSGATGYPYIAGTGSLAVLGPPAANPINIVAAADGGNFVISWPSDHTGWHLQVQTNSLGKGLGTNWVDMANTSAVNKFTNVLNRTNSAVFYRLTYP